MIDDGRTDGTVTYEDGVAVIRFERDLPAPPAVVWVAITDPQFLQRWWGQADIEPRQGGRFNLTWLNPTPQGDRLTMHAKIITFDPPHTFEIAGDIHGILRFELRAAGAGTTLVFTSKLDLPDEFKSRTVAGWHYHLSALRFALTGGTADLVELPEWAGIHDRYVALLS